jgi:hypothetical protein
MLSKVLKPKSLNQISLPLWNAATCVSRVPRVARGRFLAWRKAWRGGLSVGELSWRVWLRCARAFWLVLNRHLPPQIGQFLAYQVGLCTSDFMGPTFIYLWVTMQNLSLNWGLVNQIIYMPSHLKSFWSGLWCHCRAMARRIFAARQQDKLLIQWVIAKLRQHASLDQGCCFPLTLWLPR